MDTSMGLSSIASLSLGLSMSMTCTQQHQFKPQHRQFYSKRASVCSASFAIRPTTLPRMPSSASFHVAADVTSSTTAHSTPREATTQVEVHPSSQGTQWVHLKVLEPEQPFNLHAPRCVTFDDKKLIATCKCFISTSGIESRILATSFSWNFPRCYVLSTAHWNVWNLGQAIFLRITTSGEITRNLYWSAD